MADQKCAHEGCQCTVAQGAGVSKGDKTYCSDHCATAGPTHGSGRCQCGHAGCN